MNLTWIGQGGFVSEAEGYRANPAMQFCLQAVREGWLGEVFEVQGSMSHDCGGPSNCV